MKKQKLVKEEKLDKFGDIKDEKKEPMTARKKSFL